MKKANRPSRKRQGVSARKPTARSQVWRQRDHVMPLALCPHCGHATNRAGAVDAKDTRSPEPDDLTLCIRCGTIAKYGGDLRLVPAGEQDLLEMQTEAPDEFRRMLDLQDFIRTKLPKEPPVPTGSA